MRRWVMVFMIFSSVTVPSTASAQEAPTEPRELESFDLGEERIEGKIRKPEVTLIIAPEQFKYEDLSLQQSFVHLILSDARMNPF